MKRWRISLRGITSRYSRLTFALLIIDYAAGAKASIRNSVIRAGTVGSPNIIIIRFRHSARCKAANASWKLDNDCIMTPGWTRTFAFAHSEINLLSAVACWHYRRDDLVYDLAKKKIRRLGRHEVLEHPWVCGTRFLDKAEVYRRLGLVQGDTLSHYWIRTALAGYINGFYYPLIYQEHMDDPLVRPTQC